MDEYVSVFVSDKKRPPRLAVFSAIFLIALLMPFKAFSYIGQSYNQMVADYGTPAPVPLNSAVNSSELAKYNAEGVSVSSYEFTIDGFNMITLFNSSGICYEMKTFHNKSLPNPADLIGAVLAASQPQVLSRQWLRSATLRYGTGSGAVIYATFGFPGNLSAVAYSPSLKP